METPPKKIKIAREASDLRGRLREQVNLLQMACGLYDSGKREAAKFMAVTIRLLLHQTQNSHALLEQLKIRQVRFYEWNFAGPRDAGVRAKDWTLQIKGPLGDVPNANTQNFVAPVTASCWLAIAFSGKDGSEYVAPLSSLGTMTRKRFPPWWNDVVVRDLKQRTLNRRDLVLEIANTDGGAHVDPQLEERYMEFSRKNSMNWGFSTNGRDWQAIPDPHLPCMRQIAHEVLMTIQRRAAWAFSEPYTFPKDPLDGRDGFAVGGIVLEEGVR